MGNLCYNNENSINNSSLNLYDKVGKFMNEDKALERFLNEAEVLFDGNTYKLNQGERQQIKEALEMAFWDAKKRNKRKKE